MYDRVFTVITDHQPLLGRLGEDRAISAMASARIERWALTLGNYQYHLCFRPGRKIANADGLSRLPVDEAPTEVPVPAEVVLSMTTLDKSPVTAAQVATWTRRDPLLSAVVRFVQHGWPDSPGEEYAVYIRRKEELSVQAGCLMWGSRVIIPTPWIEAILSELHECQPGIVRMKAVARSFAWWPGINDEILAKVRACEVCQQQRNAPHTAQLHPWEWPGQPWHRIHVDYPGPMDGKMVLVIVDAHSKYIDAHIVNAATSSATITKLRQTFATHGLPSALVSDNATCFKSSEFEEFCRLNGIQHVTSAPFRPASNGAAERAVQTVKAGLRKTEGRDMQTRLYRFLLHYRVTPQTTTGQAPAELLMGRKPRTRMHLVQPDIKDTVLRK